MRACPCSFIYIPFSSSAHTYHSPLQQPTHASPIQHSVALLIPSIPVATTQDGIPHTHIMYTSPRPTSLLFCSRLVSPRSSSSFASAHSRLSFQQLSASSGTSVDPLSGRRLAIRRLCLLPHSPPLVLPIPLDRISFVSIPHPHRLPLTLSKPTRCPSCRLSDLFVGLPTCCRRSYYIYPIHGCRWPRLALDRDRCYPPCRHLSIPCPASLTSG